MTFFYPKKAGEGQGVQFSPITVFDGKCLNLQMSLTNCSASSSRVRDVNVKKIPSKVGQGHGVQFSQLHHLMTHVKVYKTPV